MAPQKERYELLKSNGICPTCGGSTFSNSTYCPNCREKKRIKWARKNPRPKEILCEVCHTPVEVKPIGLIPKYCKDCAYKKRLKIMSDWQRNEHNRIRRRPYEKEYRQKWRRNNRERSLDNDLRRKYGITLENFQALFIVQDGKCAICSEAIPSIYDEPKKRKQLAVDHDHKTKKIRGIICRNCNWALGFFKDSIDILKSAIQYLEKTP